MGWGCLVAGEYRPPADVTRAVHGAYFDDSGPSDVEFACMERALSEGLPLLVRDDDLIDVAARHLYAAYIADLPETGIRWDELALREKGDWRRYGCDLLKALFSEIPKGDNPNG